MKAPVYVCNGCGRFNLRRSGQQLSFHLYCRDCGRAAALREEKRRRRNRDKGLRIPPTHATRLYHRRYVAWWRAERKIWAALDGLAVEGGVYLFLNPLTFQFSLDSNEN